MTGSTNGQWQRHSHRTCNVPSILAILAVTSGMIKLYRALMDGRSLITDVPAARWSLDLQNQFGGAISTARTHRCLFLEPVTNYDAKFCGIRFLSIDATELQQRVLLEIAWEAMQQVDSDCNVWHHSCTGMYYVTLLSHNYRSLHFEQGRESDEIAWRDRSIPAESHGTWCAVFTVNPDGTRNSLLVVGHANTNRSWSVIVVVLSHGTFPKRSVIADLRHHFVWYECAVATSRIELNRTFIDPPRPYVAAHILILTRACCLFIVEMRILTNLGLVVDDIMSVVEPTCRARERELYPDAQYRLPHRPSTNHRPRTSYRLRRLECSKGVATHGN